MMLNKRALTNNSASFAYVFVRRGASRSRNITLQGRDFYSLSVYTILVECVERVDESARRRQTTTERFVSLLYALLRSSST